MKMFIELSSLFENSSEFTKINKMDTRVLTEIYNVSYERCKKIGNLNVILDNYQKPNQKEKSFLELAKSGHLDNQYKSTNGNIFSIQYNDYEYHSMATELIEYTAISEDGEVVEIDSEDTDNETDDSDDNGDGDDDDPSHPLALVKQNKARKNISSFISRYIGIFLTILSFFFNFIYNSNINIIILLPINELITKLINLIINSDLLSTIIARFYLLEQFFNIVSNT